VAVWGAAGWVTVSIVKSTGVVQTGLIALSIPDHTGNITAWRTFTWSRTVPTIELTTTLVTGWITDPIAQVLSWAESLCIAGGTVLPVILARRVVTRLLTVPVPDHRSIAVHRTAVLIRKCTVPSIVPTLWNIAHAITMAIPNPVI
jgi:hypothetical protein